MDLSRGLNDRGVEMHLAVLGLPPTAEKHRQAQQSGARLHSHSAGLEGTRAPWNDGARSGVWLRGLAQRLRPDIVHLNHFAPSEIEWPCATVLCVHGCVCSWWRAVRGRVTPRQWDRYRRTAEAGLSTVDRVVAPTYAMLASLENEYRISARTQVIYHGQSAAPPPSLKTAFVLTSGSPGDRARNLDALQAAARHLFWPLYIAGTRRPACPRGPCRHLGALQQADMAMWLSRASIYALPARYEPTAMAPLDAAISRCALVLGDIPALREVWDGAAAFVEPDDQEHLVRAINDLAMDDARRRRLADRAGDRAAQFTCDHMAREYHDLYVRLLSERSPMQVPSERLRRRTA
jgi:glycogen synthase